MGSATSVVARHGDHGRATERRKRLGGNAVGGDAALAESLVAAAHGLHRHAGSLGDLDARVARRGGGAVVQAAQPLQRGEPPQLVTAAGHLEGVDVERGEQLTLVLDDPFGGFGQVLVGARH